MIFLTDTPHPFKFVDTTNKRDEFNNRNEELSEGRTKEKPVQWREQKIKTTEISREETGIPDIIAKQSQK